MRLESALYSSREGLNAHGQAIAVVGDNVSNVSTVGYKESRIEFSDLFSTGGGGTDDLPLTAAGNGVAVSQVTQIHESGTLEYTGRSLDYAVEGTGFFQVGDPASPQYTRAGNFHIDADGQLVEQNGLAVLGFAPDGTTLGPINFLDINTAGSASTTATIGGNLDASAGVATVPTAPQSYNELGQAASATASLDIYDSLGARHTVDIYYFKTAGGTWTAKAYMDGGDVNGGTAGVPREVGSANLTFGPDGVMTSAGTMTISANYANGASPASVALDMSAYNQYASPSTLTSAVVNGQGVGNITDFETSSTGEIFGVLDNGARVPVGTLQLATFPNVNGLNRAGNGLYTRSDLTGKPITGAPGSTSLGTVQYGALEQSTVDLPEQFINLVLYQRGYQASSQTLNAANTMLRDTLQLIR